MAFKPSDDGREQIELMVGKIVVDSLPVIAALIALSALSKILLWWVVNGPRPIPSVEWDVLLKYWR